MIYTRFGEEITLIRLATIDDVKTFEDRKPDKIDRERTRDGWRAIAEYVEDTGGLKILVDASYLRASNGWAEISAAFRSLPGAPTDR